MEAAYLRNRRPHVAAIRSMNKPSILQTSASAARIQFRPSLRPCDTHSPAADDNRRNICPRCTALLCCAQLVSYESKRVDNQLIGQVTEDATFPGKLAPNPNIWSANNQNKDTRHPPAVCQGC